ncbi:DUF4041 domain-containing protein [Otoolea muris]|uniref:DUF4041 domain-containing protein n=1 Tax=Otoolea muris TaxID=2941515 RepID=UPI002041FFB2|nr:DUF4041 domain-containing protein [Otoolea muris]
MEKKWYLQTWFICLLFLFWFAYGIPLILGIVLLALKLKQEKAFYSQFEQLTTEVNHIKELFAPEMQELHKLQELVDSLHAEEISTKSELENAKKAAEKDIQKKKAEKYILEKDIIDKKSDINILEREIAEKKKQVVLLDDEILVQEFGLYKPQFDFASALDYKEALAAIRANQKELIKNKQAVTGNTNWQVNGSASKGKKMVSDTQKLLLRAFNSECDELVSKVKYTNFDASLDKIYKSAETISKLGTIMDIAITQQYLSAKVKELRLAFEYQTKKQQEKEAQKAARAEQREQAKIQKELDEQRGKIEKEQTHYQTAFEKIQSQLQIHPDDPDLLDKKLQLENRLSDIDKALTDIDYRQANMKAGYVYIISNIGAFGENVYKIGMTRRLDPQDRVDELGDASVPFNFDVHAMIFSDDAPALEAALHRAFENRKLNMVNQRREFFNVTLDEIKEVIKKNFDKTVEFIDVPDAEQYRISLKMKANIPTSINAPVS